MTVAALYVASGGAYYGLPNVEPWGLPERDARDYSGPHPVVAHPPCGSWVAPLAFVNETRYGHPVGGDKGCFASAMWAVRKFGGVLEHPASTTAFKFFGLPTPQRGSWQIAGPDLWVTKCSQSAYGHRARKQTFLLYAGRDPGPICWDDLKGEALVSWLPNTSRDAPRLSKREAKATPPKFRDMLLALAVGAGV